MDCHRCGRRGLRDPDGFEPTRCDGCNRTVPDCICPPKPGYPIGQYAEAASGPAEDTEAAFRGAVNSRKGMLRIERAARAEVDAEGVAVPPAPVTGTAFLAEPDEDVTYRITGLWPAGGNILLAAQAKAGKTTLTGSLVRSLCDGDPFLDQHHADPPPGTVFLIDAEMPRHQARRWLRAQGIRKTDRFTYQPLRGSAASFNLLLPEVRRRWAARIRAASASVLIIDPIGPILNACGIDENTAEVGTFLDHALGELLTDAEVTECAVVHHMGHSGERSRGNSRLRGWPDAEWFLVRQDDSPSSPRFFSAYGRDVDMPESRLEYDPDTRRLTIAGGSRKAAVAAAALSDLIKIICAHPGINTRALEDALCSGDMAHSRDAGRAAVSTALREGLILRKDGPNRSKLHYPTDQAEPLLTGVP